MTVVKRGKIVVIVAPSGTGKTTLLSMIRPRFLNLEESVSFTTRPKRPMEINGREYYFIKHEEFEAKLKSNDFLEYARVHSNYYGTEKNFVEKKISEGVNLIFDLDVQGCDSFKKYFGKEANVIFITPPSIEELERRLRGRKTETQEVILERLRNARREILRKDDFDYLIVNDDLETAADDLEKVVRSILEGRQ